MEEIWREIPGFDGKYLISNLGRAGSRIKEKIKILKTYHHGGKKRAYLAFRALYNGKRKHISVSRAVAKAFPEICGEWFEGCDVDHINTIKTDNRPENLRVCTRKENINNPLTIAKKRGFKTDEEWSEYQKEKEREYKKKDYENHKEYYKKYIKEYQKRPEVKEKLKKYQKEYHKKKYDTNEEYRNKVKEASLRYYYKKKAS